MALINIQTNLKSLKYTDFGVDAPLVTKSINNPPNQSGLSMEIGRRTDDLERIGKLLISGPGLNHLGRQAALNVLEKNISSKFDNKSGVGRVLSGLGSTATYLASTLAQVPVNGTGTHFVEGFAGKRGYLPQIQGHVLSRNGGKANIDTSTPLLQDTEGNPTRFESIGNNTDLSRENDTRKFTDVKKSIFEDPDDLERQGRILTQYSGSGYNSTPLAYYSKETAKNAAQAPQTGSYGTSMDTGFIDKGARLDDNSPIDIINVAAPNTLNLNDLPDELKVNNLVDEDLQKLFGGDLIKFYFTIVTPQRGAEDQPKVIPLYFRAYLDSFSDNFSSSWNSFKYIGRAEDFYSYEGFSRSVNIGFKIAASSPAELEPLINKLNLLAGSTAPTYTKGSYMRGNFSTATVGDYLNKQPGIVESVDISWDTDYPWSTRFNTKAGGRELPTVLDVSVKFTPIHSNTPMFKSGFIGKENKLLTGSN